MAVLVGAIAAAPGLPTPFGFLLMPVLVIALAVVARRLQPRAVHRLRLTRRAASVAGGSASLIVGLVACSTLLAQHAGWWAPAACAGFAALLTLITGRALDRLIATQR